MENHSRIAGILAIFTLFLAGILAPPPTANAAVLGRDDRISLRDHKLADALLAVVQIYCYVDGKLHTGSGFYVGEGSVLTVAHMFAPVKHNYKEKCKIAVGDSAADNSWNERKYFKIEAALFGEPPSDARNLTEDWAALYSSKLKLENLSHFDVALLDAKLKNNWDYKDSINLAGYPQDIEGKNFIRTGHFGCKIKRFRVRRRGKFKAEEVYYDCDNYKGASGGPVFIIRYTDQGKPELFALAINAFEESGVNVGIGIDSDIFNKVIKFIKKTRRYK